MISVKQYNNLTKAILATARAKAAEDMMVNNSKRRLTGITRKGRLAKQVDTKQNELDVAMKNSKLLLIFFAN